jgi:hypothetical protein
MKLYPRNLFDQILPKLDGKEAIFIFGARQCADNPAETVDA